MRLLLTILFVTTLGTSLSAFAQSSSGVFKVVKGDVSVTAKDGKASKAKLGMKVSPGDKIKAGADSRAKIVMVDNNELNVSPDSEIVIENYEFKKNEDKKNVLINVLYGKVRAKVNQKYEGENKFQVKTKSAVAGVRGTDFFTSYTPATNATKVVTFEGKVQFGLPGPNGAILNPVMVGVGQTTSVVGNAPPPPPVEVPKSEMASIDTGSNAEASASAPREPAAGGPAPAAAPAEQAPAPKSEARTPASTGPAPGPAAPAPAAGSMITSADLPSTGNIVRPVDIPKPPVVLPPMPPPNLNPCPMCSQIIEGQQKTLRISITNGG